MKTLLRNTSRRVPAIAAALSGGLVLAFSPIGEATQHMMADSETAFLSPRDLTLGDDFDTRIPPSIPAHRNEGSAAAPETSEIVETGVAAPPQQAPVSAHPAGHGNSSGGHHDGPRHHHGATSGSPTSHNDHGHGHGNVEDQPLNEEAGNLVQTAVEVLNGHGNGNGNGHGHGNGNGHGNGHGNGKKTGKAPSGQPDTAGHKNHAGKHHSKGNKKH